jgi:hypothetical protein
VFLPCRAELCRVIPCPPPTALHCLVSHCQATAITLGWRKSGRGSCDLHVIHSDVMHFCSDATIEELFSRVSDQGFIGETEACVQVVLE